MQRESAKLTLPRALGPPDKPLVGVVTVPTLQVGRRAQQGALGVPDTGTQVGGGKAQLRTGSGTCELQAPSSCTAGPGLRSRRRGTYYAPGPGRRVLLLGRPVWYSEPGQQNRELLSAPPGQSPSHRQGEGAGGCLRLQGEELTGGEL